MQTKRKYGLIILVLALNLNTVFAQDIPWENSWWAQFTKLKGFQLSEGFYLSASDKNAKEVMQDNEFDRNVAGRYVYFNANPLMLDGKQLDYGTFTVFSKGVLTVVKGKPETLEAESIPFYVYIRRDGKILKNKKMLFANKVLKQINLSELSPFTLQGDLLIIKPARADDWRAKRVLKLIGGGC